MILRDIQKQLSLIAEEFDIKIDTNDIISFTEHADISTNIAFKISKKLNKNPMDICNIIIEKLDSTLIEKIEKRKPGFINIWIKNKLLSNEIIEIIEKDNYGKISNKNRYINLEFVSANPTGPLVIVNARAGIVGMTLANILRYAGYDVVKEYYVNDSGNQIRMLGESILWYIIDDKDIPFPENGYRGDYIKELALMIKEKISDYVWNDKNIDICSYEAKNIILKWQRDTLNRYGIEFDNWVYESEIKKSGYIEKVMDIFEKRELLYEEDNALFFKSSLFFDEKDRVLRKSDNQYSYLMPDIAYHYYKIERGFDEIIDILGPDHHGYINRLKSAIYILNKNVKFNVIIAQLINLFKNGQKFEMSKRKGDFITMDELADEVDVDIVKFIFLTRKLSQPIDFDIEEAKKTTLDNPVYYIQYAHARICSLFEKFNKEFNTVSIDNLIKNNKEARRIVIKIMEYPYVLYGIAKSYEIQKLTNYVYELSGLFHRYYYNNRILCEDENQTLMNLTLALGVKKIIANILALINIKPKKRMEQSEV